MHPAPAGVPEAAAPDADARFKAALRRDDLDGALKELRGLLDAPGWHRFDAARIAAYTRAVNDGKPFHHLQAPPTPSVPAATSERVIEPSDYRRDAIDTLGLVPRPVAIARSSGPVRRPPVDVWTIPDATVVFVKGAFLIKDARGTTVGAVSGRGSTALESVADVLIERKPAIEIDGRALFLPDISDGASYCHWLSNHLTRLAIYQSAGLTPAPILVQTLARPFHTATLARLEDVAPAAFAMDEAPVARVKELIVADDVGEGFCHPAHWVAPWAVDLLRDRLGPSRRAQPTDRLYVSRSDARRRRVVNEGELIAELERRGFRSVVLTGMDVFEQAELFSRAEAVVGPHGAGLTNLFFAQPGARVLEMFSGSNGTAAFASIASVTSLDYTSIGFPAMPAAAPGAVHGPDTVDMIADIAQVIAWVDGAAVTARETSGSVRVV